MRLLDEKNVRFTKMFDEKLYNQCVSDFEKIQNGLANAINYFSANNYNVAVIKS